MGHRKDRRPIIGICSRPGNDNADLSVIDTHYSNAILRAGGIPVSLPHGFEPAAIAEEIVTQIDGLLLTGGGDIAPESFGGHPYADGCVASISYLSVERDVFEWAAAKAAWTQGVPCFGICRGMQVMNVTLGGTIVRDISELGGGRLDHACFGRGSDLVHKVSIEEGSRLADSLDAGEFSVNSMHHQAVCDAAVGSKITAWATDGTPEGLEFPGHPFYMGVQWHPEWLPSMAPLFEAFVRACKEESGAR